MPPTNDPACKVRCAATPLDEAYGVAAAIRAAGVAPGEVAVYALEEFDAARLAGILHGAGITVAGSPAPALARFIALALRWIAAGEPPAAARLAGSRYFGLAQRLGRELAIAIERNQPTPDPPVAAARERLEQLRTAAATSIPEQLKAIARACSFDTVLNDDERASFEALYLQHLEGAAQSAQAGAGVRVRLLSESAPPCTLAVIIGLSASAFPRPFRGRAAEQSALRATLAGARHAILSYAGEPSALIAGLGTAEPFAGRAPAFAPALLHPVHAPAPVRARRLQFSASQLGVYDECRRKWFFRYVCAAVEEATSAAATYGKAFHAALEDFHTDVRRPGDLEEPALRNRLDGAINGAFTRFATQFPSKVEAELSRRRALRTARRYADWLLDRARRRPFEVVACEQEVRLDLDGFPFVGYIDRLDRDLSTGNVTVVDYKTGVIAGDARAYRENIVSGHDFQLPFYYWAQRNAGERVAALALVPLKDEMASVVPVELEVSAGEPPPPARGGAAARSGVISISALERARARMVQLCAEIARAEPERFAATSDPQACTYCSYKAACRERPEPREIRWAR